MIAATIVIGPGRYVEHHGEWIVVPDGLRAVKCSACEWVRLVPIRDGLDELERVRIVHLDVVHSARAVFG
jgi:hypothetical protein